MKKKNVLLMALSMVLVAVISIGSTLAYLTATDGAITNTFTFANNIKVELTEPQPTGLGNASVSGDTESGWNYTNVVPGQTLDKQPTFSVETSVDAYVFARVTESSNVSVLNYNTAAGGWTYLKDDAGKKVYYKAVTASVSEGVAVNQPLGALFTQVKISENIDLAGTTTVTLNPITIEVAAIQQAGFTTPEAAYAKAVFQAQA